MVTRYKPANEEARVVALEKYAILEPTRSKSFDDFTLLASYICKTPIALISLVDEDRQWFKSRVGMDATRDFAGHRFLFHCHFANPTSSSSPTPLADERFRRQSSRHFRPAHPVLRRRPPDQRRRFTPSAHFASSIAHPANWCPIRKTRLKTLSRLVLCQLEFRRNLILLKEALTEPHQGGNTSASASSSTSRKP